MTNMAGYANNSCERCRFCGLDLPPDTVSLVAHYNTHWRQCNGENVANLSPCAYEPQLDIRIGPAPINPEDLEVSGHLEHPNFQYSYSPQTEPSNLSLTGTRCSPLNLTGRPKSESPLTSPLASPLPTESHVTAQTHTPTLNMNTQQNQIHNVAVHSDLNVVHQYSNFNNGMFNSCHIPNQMMSSIQINETIDMSCSGDNPEINSGCDHSKKRKRPPDRESRCLGCNRNFYTKASYDDHFHVFHSKNIIDANTQSNNFLMSNDSVDLNHHSIQEVSNVIPCQLSVVKPYKCSICDQEFMYSQELNEHANNHEASKPYRCELCGTGLSHISALKRHILSHSGHKPHTCEICNRGFFQKCDLVRHYSTHGRRKDIQCSHCKKRYFSEYLYKNHKCKPPEDPKPFKCDICGNSCSTNIAWSYHMWKHTKNPIFVPFQSKKGSSKILGVNLAQKNNLTSA